ncbi:MAG: adenine methyltransferase [Patescibacteria group bacterium]|nr:adenine methyltransferase [Patescibacteria group bacterium]
MALHEQCVGKSDEWYTPPHVFSAMGGSFDLDVSSPGRSVTPWIPAVDFITSGSLDRDWRGFVWMNPPFGGRSGLIPWLEKFVAHGDGVCLVPNRTSAPWWQEFAPRADLALFVARKIRFIAGFDDPEHDIVLGQPGKSPAQGTTLLACGPRGRENLRRAAADGLGCLFKPV